MTFGRFLATLYAVLFLALSLYAGVSFMQTYGELANQRTVEKQNREKLANTEKELRDQQQMLSLLREDPQFIESMIRRKLHYVKPDEVIFRFDPARPQTQTVRPLN